MLITKQVLTGVNVKPIYPIRIDTNARVTCFFSGQNLQIQYIIWTKHYIGGGKVFVYGYDSCLNENSGYNDLAARSILDVVNPKDPETPKSPNQADPNSDERLSNSTVPYAAGGILSQENQNGGSSVYQNGSATLTIFGTALGDEARYECLVKVVGYPALSSEQLLTVVGEFHFTCKILLKSHFPSWCDMPTFAVHYTSNHTKDLLLISHLISSYHLMNSICHTICQYKCSI